jgi:endoglucanase
MAQRQNYGSQSAVDLQNEPHSSSWAKGDIETDWGHAAERLGNHVLNQCGRWLIFVEGVGYRPGAPGMDDGGAGIWWGENLAGVKRQPISLADPTKLVYSPHTYGPSVYGQNYFYAPNFPQNMPDIWENRFDFVRQLTGSPVVIGEIGGHYTGLDKAWQDCASPGLGPSNSHLAP